MKKIIVSIMMVCVLLCVSACASQNDCACASQNDCACAKENIYRESIRSDLDWTEKKNIYDFLPENSEVIEIIDKTTDSHFPTYDIIYTIHNCGK